MKTNQNLSHPKYYSNSNRISQDFKQSYLKSLQLILDDEKFKEKADTLPLLKSSVINKYEKMYKAMNLEIPHLHPHLFRHTRAMHLYRAGMPLALIGEWLGHSHLETTLIYAYADTSMKRNAIEKVMNANNTVFSDEEFIYKNDEEVIRKLYGLG